MQTQPVSQRACEQASFIQSVRQPAVRASFDGIRYHFQWVIIFKCCGCCKTIKNQATKQKQNHMNRSIETEFSYEKWQQNCYTSRILLLLNFKRSIPIKISERRWRGEREGGRRLEKVMRNTWINAWNYIVEFWRRRFRTPVDVFCYAFLRLQIVLTIPCPR